MKKEDRKKLIFVSGDGDVENYDVYFYKDKSTDKVWWVERFQVIDGVYTTPIGEFLFSFDKRKIYNLFHDYRNLSIKEKNIFDKENPFWANFFNAKDRI